MNKTVIARREKKFMNKTVTARIEKKKFFCTECNKRWVFPRNI